MELIRAHKVSKVFGGLVAVSDLNLTLQQGEILGLIGPNGSGKSTTLNLLTGFYRPSSGAIFYKDKDLGKVPTWRIASLGLARTFQTPVVFPQLTVLENVMVGCHRQGTSSWLASGLALRSVQREEKLLRGRAMEALAAVGLVDRAAERPDALPFGLQRMVEMARVLAANPQVVLLDEPASGLNPTERALLVELVRGLRNRGLSVILVEHDVALVQSLVDRLLVMAEGALIAEGDPSAVLRDKQVISAYLGSAAV